MHNRPSRRWHDCALGVGVDSGRSPVFVCSLISGEPFAIQETSDTDTFFT